MSETIAELAALRRVDWRFLLPIERPGRTALLELAGGKQDADLRAGLAIVSEHLALIDSSHAAVSDQRDAFDLVVVTEACRNAIAQATDLLAPGGWLYMELPKRRRWFPYRNLGPWRRDLGRLGYGVPSVQWHHPSFSDCSEIMAVERSGAPREAIERKRGSSAGQLMRGIAATGLLPGLIPHASILAQRQTAEPRAEEVFPGGLSRRIARITDPATGIRDLDYLLLTPRFATSRHIVFLASERPLRPTIAVKVPRVAKDVSALRRERTVLSKLGGQGGGLVGSVPRVIGYEEGPNSFLAESAFSGRLLDRVYVRRDPDRAIRSVTAWLNQLSAVQRRPGSPRWQASLLADAMRRVEDLHPTWRFARHALKSARRHIDAATEADLPMVAEHGDLSHPNLIVLPDGAVGVLDWELARFDGMPLHDMAFFLMYVAAARADASRPTEHARAFDDAFISGKRWAMPHLLQALRELSLPPSLIGPLVVACWTRVLAALPDRLAAGNRAGVGFEGDSAASRQVARVRAVWLRAIDLADQITDEMPRQ